MNWGAGTYTFDRVAFRVAPEILDVANGGAIFILRAQRVIDTQSLACRFGVFHLFVHSYCLVRVASENNLALIENQYVGAE